MRTHYVLLAVSVLSLSCGNDARRTVRTEDKNAALGGDIAARVGDQAIPLSVVASVANAQKLSARDAARKVVDDEIAASAARAQGLDRQVPASWRLVSARARLASDRVSQEARSKGPPTDEEVNILSEKHWEVVDRPPSVRVIHAIVMRPKDPALLPAARTLANEMHAALGAASAAEDFEKTARSLPHDSKLEVKVENLPPFTEEGRVTEAPSMMDSVFSKAAFALGAPGATSTVVETTFGFHVIRLIERIPELRMPFETRRLAFTEETYTMRAYDLVRARLKALHETTPVAVSPAAEQLMRAVKIGSPPVAAP